MSDVSKPKKKSCIIRHKLKRYRKKATAFNFLRHCLLRDLPFTAKNTVHLVKLLQCRMRLQYVRLMHQIPLKRYSLTYRMNCRPVGFDVSPPTQACKRPQACPWCFVRCWLVPAFKALTAVPINLRVGCSVISWERVVSAESPLPFFRADYGPHQWCKSLATSQLVVPWFSPVADVAVYRHLGFQIIPASCDFLKALQRRSVCPSLQVRVLPKATDVNIIRMVSRQAWLPWAEFFSESRFDFFSRVVLNPANKSSRLLRINSYKS